MAPLLEVRGLSVTYTGARRAVSDISFDVNAGDTVALVGESGSGKTATALAVMRLLAPGAQVEGRVKLEGTDVMTLPEPAMRQIRGRRMSMVFQDPASALNPTMRVGHQVAETALVHGEHSARAAHDMAVAMLERTGFRDPVDVAERFPHELSGGMRQRVVIAMALLLGPALVIADEPTSSLDVTVQAQILDLLASLQQEWGTAVLLVTHDLGVVAERCSRAMVMQTGRIVESGATDQIFHAPANPYTRDLLHAVPRLVVS